jgi:hypothetical protein
MRQQANLGPARPQDDVGAHGYQPKPTLLARADEVIELISRLWPSALVGLSFGRPQPHSNLANNLFASS